MKTNQMKFLTQKLYLFLSFTWGLPLTLIGLVVFRVLYLLGFEAKRYGWAWYFEIGHDWGGVSFGPVFIVEKVDEQRYISNASYRYSYDYLRSHEFGHGIQNCFLGPFEVVSVFIPSVLRYWYSRYLDYTHQPFDYYSIWFEKQASDLGQFYMKERV